jgi:hypothetical protein
VDGEQMWVGYKLASNILEIEARNDQAQPRRLQRLVGRNSVLHGLHYL